MTALFDTFSDLGAILLSDIRRIVDLPTAARAAVPSRLYLHDGRCVDLHQHDRNRLMLRPVQMIPAQPGTSVIWACDLETDAPYLNRAPVVAWALCLDGEVRPVTPNGVNDAQDCKDGTYVEMPDGTVQSVGEWNDALAYENADAMLRDQQRGVQEKAKRASAAAGEVRQ